MKILLVEDEFYTVILACLVKAASTSQFPLDQLIVCLVKSGSQAYACYEAAAKSSQPYEVILMDNTLEDGIVGLDTAKNIRTFEEKNPTIPKAKIYSISGDREAKSEAFDGYFCKPVSPANLSSLFTPKNDAKATTTDTNSTDTIEVFGVPKPIAILQIEIAGQSNDMFSMPSPFLQPRFFANVSQAAAAAPDNVNEPLVPKPAPKSDSGT